MDELEFEAGHLFFEAGDAGDSAWLVQEGEVELLGRAAEALVRMRMARAGDVIGEMALVDERPREMTARAVSAGRAVQVSRASFEGHLLAPLPILECLRVLFERLRSGGHSEDSGVRIQESGMLRLEGPVAEEPEFLTDEAEPPALLADAVEYPVSQGKDSEWSVVIHPLTRKAAETLPEEGLLVTRFPLRVGRAAGAGEGEALDLNDLWLLDDAPFNVSRNHCEIYVDGVGPAVRDRGSQLGCVVNETSIGGRGRLRSCGLELGDNVVVVGSRVSPYQFRVTVSQREAVEGE